MRKYPGYPAKPTKAALQLADAAQAPTHLADQLMPPVRKPRAKSGRPEEKLQIGCVKFLRYALPPDAVFFHIPNQGKRSRVYGYRMKAMGMWTGFPDLMVIWRRLALCGELKVNGQLTEAQSECHNRLRLAGVPVYIWRSIEEMVSDITANGIPLKARI